MCNVILGDGMKESDVAVMTTHGLIHSVLLLSNDHETPRGDTWLPFQFAPSSSPSTALTSQAWGRVISALSFVVFPVFTLSHENSVGGQLYYVSSFLYPKSARFTKRRDYGVPTSQGVMMLSTPTYYITRR